MGVMGKRGEQPKKKYTEREIQNILREHFMSGPNGARYQIENLFVYNWESDFLYITKAGYSYEIEIKVSRSDFFNDMEKKTKHAILEGTYVKRSYEKTVERPNYFYYAVPKDLVKEEEVPEYAGLIYITEIWPYVDVIKPPPQIHEEKIDEERLKLTDKFYYNYLSWKQKAETEFNKKIEELKNRLDEQKTVDGVKYKYTIKDAHEKIKDLERHIKALQEQDKMWYDRWNRSLSMEAELRNLAYKHGATHDEIFEIKRKISEMFDKEDDSGTVFA